MIVHPPIAVVYISSNYFMNMIHAIDIWMFMLFILGGFIECMGVFIGCRNRPAIEVGASTL
jgi:hypothetical protein